MRERSDLIQVFEHQTIKVGFEGKFLPRHFRALEHYGYRTAEKYFAIGNDRIKFTSYVGVIQIRNLTIEILPKVDKDKGMQASSARWHDALVSLLRECRLIKVESTM